MLSRYLFILRLRLSEVDTCVHIPNLLDRFEQFNGKIVHNILHAAKSHALPVRNKLVQPI